MSWLNDLFSHFLAEMKIYSWTLKFWNIKSLETHDHLCKTMCNLQHFFARQNNSDLLFRFRKFELFASKSENSRSYFIFLFPIVIFRMSLVFKIMNPYISSLNLKLKILWNPRELKFQSAKITFHLLFTF